MSLEDQMNWIKVLSHSEFADGQRTVVPVGERSILLIHHEGTVYALESRCPHMRLPLKGATVETSTAGTTLTCPWHHSAFDLRTGDVRDWSPWPPAVGKMLGALRRERALTVYPVKVEQGAIWVQVPDDGPQTTDDE
jgi:nitrite reductase/ring-hydroxylating ferredoxin subunit